MMKRWMAVSLTTLTVCCNPAWTQTATTPAADPATQIVGEPVSNKKGPKLVCPEPTFNFGQRPNTTNVEHVFQIRNDGDEVLVVDNVKASCGCTVANISNRNIAPGESSEITAKLSLRGRKGIQNKQITVYCNDPSNLRMALRLTGSAIAEIDTVPAFLNFGDLSENQTTNRTFKIIGNIEGPYTVTEVQALSKLVTTELITITEGKDYAVKVTVPAGSKIGLLNERVRVKTDYAKLPYMDVRVTARVTGKLVVSPDKLVLQENDERALTRYVMIGSGSVKEFNVLDVIWPGEGVTIAQHPKEGRGVQIELKNVIGLKSLHGKNILIKTDVPELAEIKIPILISPGRP